MEALYPLLLHHGTPEYIRSDNGPEFAAKATQDWLRRVRTKSIRIYLGSPWENGHNERFNGTLRQKGHNAEWFTTTEQAQIVINRWLRQYNDTRPHQALNMRPPIPEAILEKTQITGQTTAAGQVSLNRMGKEQWVGKPGQHIGGSDSKPFVASLRE